jgi:site-specific DNA recombinase
MQAEDGLSIPAQKTEMREFAAARNWQVVGEFADPGSTGSDMNRPGLEALQAAIEAGEVDVVLVHELSRLSRSVFDTFAFFELLGRHDVGFASVKEPQFDLSTPTGRLLLTFIAGINQYYIDMLRLHTKKSKKQRVRQGLYNASIPPFGYRHAGDQRTPPVIVEAEAQGVRLAFERYATGRYSYQDVANLLNGEGYRTGRGRRYSKDTVADMLRNRFYAGKVVYKEGRRGDVGEVYEGLHEPIVGEDLWNAVERVRGRHHHASKTTGRERRSYLLSQVVRCHVCGRKLRAQSSRKAAYYREMSYARGYEDCPNAQVGVRMRKLHEQVGAIIRRLSLPADWQQELMEMIGEDDEAVTLRNRRARLVARRRRLKKAYLRGDFEEDEDIYRQELAAIRREMDQIPSGEELIQIKQAADILETVGDVWDEAEATEQNDLVRLMLREIQADVVQGRVVFLRPTAPFVPLFRAVPILEERDAGTFTPDWPDELVELLSWPVQTPVARLPEEPAALPFLAQWPWEPDPSARISPSLSDALKARRQAGHEGGVAVTVAHEGVPPLLLDERKWGGVTLERQSLSDALAREEGTVAFLSTPLAVQEHADRVGLAREVHRLLDEEGRWHVVDLVPASMAAHWVFTYFDEAWALARESYWTTHGFYNGLRRSGFAVEQREHTLRRPVTLGVALEIARRRPGLLARLADESYERGLERLEEVVEREGGAAVIPSEVTLVEVVATKRSIGQEGEASVGDS